jgi:hypothetical protein
MRVLLTALVAGMTVIGAAAQGTAPATQSPWIGKWKLRAEAPASGTREYEDRGGGVVVSTRQGVGANGRPYFSQYAAKYDGLQYPRLVKGATTAGTIAFTVVDQDSVAFTRREEGRITARGTTRVSKDRKVLTVTTKQEGATGDGNVEVYDRQPDTQVDVYTGTWTLNVAKSGGAERSQVLTIDVVGDEETYQSDMRSASGRRQLTNYKARFDGRQYPSVTVITEPDGKATREEHSVKLDKVDERTRTRTWTQKGQITILRRVVSPDGRTLTSESILVDAAGRETRAPMLLVFDKQ